MGYGMDSGGFPNGNAMPGNLDQAVWATDEEYRAWNGSGSFENLGNLNYNSEQFQGRSGSEGPNKKLRVSQQATDLQNNRAKAIGKMFFKTKLCCKFRAGTCPYVTNCNFAHSLEELRKPPPNWQEIVAAHDGEKKALEPREEFQIPSIVSTDFNGDGSRSAKGRHCKKFYTEEGCPYGDSCAYVHDEHSRARESVAITLNTGPPPSSNNYVVANGGAQNLKPGNWKTRLCNKWEMTGFCPFGSKCFFAHGLAELNQFTGGSTTPEAKGPNFPQPESTPSKMAGERTSTSSSTPAPSADMYKSGVPAQKPSCAVQGLTPRVHQKWKGPDKISRIYGDWIEDAE